MTSELRPAEDVIMGIDIALREDEMTGQGYTNGDAVRVLIADREAVRAEQAAELAKFKALAETLAGALEPVERLEMWGSSAKDSDMVILTVGTVRKMRETLRQYKEATQ